MMRWPGGETGYGAVWREQKTWNGAAILARSAQPVLSRDALPGDPDGVDTIANMISTVACLRRGQPPLWQPQRSMLAGG